MPPEGETLQAENERLRADLAAARQAQAEEAQRADALSAQVSQSNGRVSRAQVAQLAALETAADNTIASAAREIDSLKKEIAALTAEGKFAEAADLQEKMADAAARRREATAQKSYYAGQKTEAQSAPVDPVEQFLAANQGVFTAADQNWIRQNRRYVEDQGFRNRVIQAHGEALAQGKTQGSDEYYRFLTDRGYRRAEPAPPAPQERAREADGGTADDRAEPAEEPDEGDEIRITRNERTAMADSPQDTRPAFGRDAEQPQERAAGPGSMRGVIAAAPSRRPVSSSGRRTVLELTEAQADHALALAAHLAPDDVLAAGKPGIFKWYHELNTGGAADRLREGWANR